MEPQQIIANSKVQLPILLDIINSITNGEPFALVIFIGKSFVGKSFLSQKLSGVKHETGSDPISNTTTGAYISYCGHMHDVISRRNLELSDQQLYHDIHVFSIDTECINGLNEASKIINYLFQLIAISSVIVYCTDEPALAAQSNLLKTIQFFARETPLVIRVSNFPEYEKINENNYRNYAMSTALFNKLIADNVEFIMIPDIPPCGSLKQKKLMKRILFTEILKKSITRIWHNTIEMRYTFQELNQITQNNFFLNSFIDPSPGKYLSDNLLQELRDYLINKKRELEEASIEKIPSILNDVYQYLVTRFSYLSEKYQINYELRKCCWDNIKHDFNIIKIISLDKYQHAQKEKMLVENSNLKQNKIKKLLTFYSSIIPNAANEAVKNIIQQSQNPVMIPQIESDKRQFELVLKQQIMDIRFLTDPKFVKIIDDDIEKISSIIDNFATMVVSTMKKKQNVETLKTVLKVVSIIGIVISIAKKTDDKNAPFAQKVAINNDDVEGIENLGFKSFKIVNAILDEIFPPQSPDQLNIPNFVQKDYYKIYEDNLSQILSADQ